LTKLRFQIDFGTGFQDVNNPINSAGLRPRIQFFDGVAQGSIDETTLEWGPEEAARFYDYRAGGLNGTTPGIYEGPGLRCWACDAPGIMFIDGYVYLSHKETRWECDMVAAPFRQAGKKQWLEEKAGAIDFAFLASLPAGSPGRIVPLTDYLLTPYTVSPVGRNDITAQSMITAATTASIAIQLYDTIMRLTNVVNKIYAWVATTTASLGITIANLLDELIEAGLLAAYIVLLLYTLVTLVIKYIQLVLQFKKYKLCMREEVVMTRICQYFGLNFSSTILQQGAYRNSTYMPAKNIIPDPINPLTVFRRPYDESVNFPNNPSVKGHPDMNVQEYIKDLCEFFNAGVSIIGNTLYFEELHHFNQVSAFTIENTAQVGYTRNLPHPSRTNADELPSRYSFSFAYRGTGDLHNEHRYEGTGVVVTVSPISTTNIKRVSHTNGVIIQAPVARACRKYYLNEVENALNDVINALFNFVNIFIQIFNTIINIINAVISVFGGNPAAIPAIPTLPTNILNNRLGWMELSDDSFSTPKRFIGENINGDWHVAASNDVYMIADQVFERFHSLNLATRGAQANIYDKNRFKFCCEDFVAITNQNCITTPNGLIGKFRGSFTWNIADDLAEDVEYEEKVIFTNNLKETKIID
jgi:hypothetical protein